MNLTVAHVYPDLLNLYGDSGNVLCIQKRCEWHGIKCIVRNFEAGSQFDFSDCDVVFIGGGQDREQQLVLQCLGAKNARELAEAVENKTVLAVCGGYQLLGKYYETAEARAWILREYLIFTRWAGKSASSEITNLKPRKKFASSALKIIRGALTSAPLPSRSAK